MVDEASECVSPGGSALRVSVRETVSSGVFLTVSASPNGDAGAEAASAYARIADAISERQIEIVQERIFGSLSVEAPVKAARREALLARGIRDDGPMTYIQGHPTWGRGFAGVILRAVAGHEVRTIRDGAEPCGRTWQTDDATFVLLQSIQGLPERPGGDDAPASQAGRAIQRADRILRENGASYRDTARTWFYLSDILGWYREFNQARSAKYQEYGLIARPEDPQPRLPASTGILADSPSGAACSLDLLAVTGSTAGRPAVQRLRNPRQQEAFRYGSAFSRCAVIHGTTEDLIEVSGTAAIDEKGSSQFRGDVRAQSRCTLEKVASLLEQADASFRDICAATVFVKHGHDAEAARDVLTKLGLDQLPAVWVVADVCREELLFEIDAEAAISRRK